MKLFHFATIDAPFDEISEAIDVQRALWKSHRVIGDMASSVVCTVSKASVTGHSEREKTSRMSSDEI